VRPTQHRSNNDVLSAPPGMDVEACRPLAITRVQYSDGTPGVWSYWHPTDEERAAIASGALVRLGVLGVTHPPMHLGGDGVENEGMA
jgi:hypothetical protein